MAKVAVVTRRVLVACERSQVVTKAFRALGVEAYSCDLVSCDNKEGKAWHIVGDARRVARDYDWALVIAHPPCTYLANAGNRWFSVERYGGKALDRYIAREQAVEFFMAFTRLRCKVAIENPVGRMSTRWRRPTQIVHPWWFGDPYEKRTCLWLRGLPPLRPTNVVRPENRIVYASGRNMPAWYAKAITKGKQEGARLRSVTFPGMAVAMADQWQRLLS